MFKNFTAIAYMRTPIAAVDPIILDSIITAAKTKEILQDEFYAGANVYGTKAEIDEMLGKILDKKSGVYCTSIGLGESREFVGNWVKRWDDKNDDIVDFKKGKVRVDVATGHLKNYHMPIVLKSYDAVVFYVRGDMEEIKRLLESHIYYLGKKGSQGYGQINKWELIEMDEDYSVWKGNEPMRPIPISECEEYIEEKMRGNEYLDTRLYPLIPPYWRNDNVETCVMPEVHK